jgi:hypothetical protein
LILGCKAQYNNREANRKVQVTDKQCREGKLFAEPQGLSIALGVVGRL